MEDITRLLLVGCCIVGAGSCMGATCLFTLSFREVDPEVARPISLVLALIGLALIGFGLYRL